MPPDATNIETASILLTLCLAMVPFCVLAMAVALDEMAARKDRAPEMPLRQRTGFVLHGRVVPITVRSQFRR